MGKQPVEFPTVACFVDDTKTCDLESLGDFQDRSGKVGRVQVMRCKRCGHGVSSPPLPDVTFLYEDRDSQDYQPDSKGLAHFIKDIAFRRQARKLLRQIGEADGRILDFGCGSGQFTRVLGQVAVRIEVVGADMHPGPPAELAGKAYLSADELGAQSGKFDTVIALHVLEHDDDAGALLGRIVGLVRPGGKIVIEVPNIDCIWTKPFGKYWDSWYLPYHRQHFTSQSLTELMRRNGLEIVSAHGVTVPTMGRTFANIFKAQNNLFWLIAGMMVHPIQLAGEWITQRRTALRVITRRFES